MLIKAKNNIAVTIAVIVIIVLSIYLLINLRVRVNEQLESIESFGKLLDEQREKVAKLQYELDRPIDDEYIIEIAREKLNYHLPNEIIFYNGRTE